MVTVVVVINLALALMLLFFAWVMWQVRSLLAQLTDSLSTYERSIHAGLRDAPTAITTTQVSIAQVQQRSLLQDLQLLRIQQVLTLFSIGQQIWQSSRSARRSRFFKKALAQYKYR